MTGRSEMQYDRHAIRLIFILNARHYPIEARLHAPLKQAVLQVFAETDNMGRPLDEWEVSNASGMLLKMKLTPNDLRLRNGARLFLSQHVERVAYTRDQT